MSMYSKHASKNQGCPGCGYTGPASPSRDFSRLHPDQNMTQADVCEFFQISRSTLNNRTNPGPYHDSSFPKASPARGKAEKGSAVRYRAGDVIDYSRGLHGLPPIHGTLSREDAD